MAAKRKKLLVLILAAVLILGVVAGALVLILGGKTMALTVKQFEFRQRAFFVGTGWTEKQLMAIIDSSQKTDGLVLRAVCDKTGDKILLTDDGQGADTFAGDGVFYGPAAFEPTSEARMTYRLEVERGRFTLPEAKATEVIFCTDEAVTAERATNRVIMDELDGIAVRYDVDEFDQELYVSVQKEIAQYLDGLVASGRIVSYEYSFPDFLVHMPIGMFVYTLDHHIDGVMSGGGEALDGSVTGGAELIEEQDMLLLLPIDYQYNNALGKRWVSNIDAFHRGMKTISDSPHGYHTAQVYKDTKVTPDVLRNMAKYRVIAIDTHGNCFDSAGTVFALDYESKNLMNTDYGNWLVLDGKTAAVSSRFFNYYYDDGQMNDSLFYLGACLSAKKTDLAETLFRKGVRTYFGFDKTVRSQYLTAFFESLATALVMKDSDKPWLTCNAEFAFGYAIGKNGKQDSFISVLESTLPGQEFQSRPAEPKCWTAPGKDPFRLVDTEIRSGLSGQVVGLDDDIPVCDAIIRVFNDDGEEYRCYSSAYGYFHTNLPTGNWYVIVSKPGYKDLKYQFTAEGRSVTKVICKLVKETGLVLPQIADSFVVSFGHYEQDNDLTNGPEPIEWLVLDHDEASNRVLLLSRYGLDSEPYNEGGDDVTWETCTLRTWLNKGFLNAAFSPAEQQAIRMTEVDNGRSQGYSEWSTDGGNNTHDMVFLLSYKEEYQYFGVESWSYYNHSSFTNVASRVEPTTYAKTNGSVTDSDFLTADGADAGWQWLRSPGDDQQRAALVYSDGSLGDVFVDTYGGTVRPAIWVDSDAILNSFVGDDSQPKETADITPAKNATQFKTVGSYVTFGSYEQDNDLTNGLEPIEWLILDYDAANNRVLLLSRYGLNTMPYNRNRKKTSVTWETCTLRAWLNKDFLNAAFTLAEQQAILTTTVDNSKSQGYSGWSINGGNNTQDKIFLLSYAEANKYFNVQRFNANDRVKNMKSRTSPTVYAKAMGAWTDSFYHTAEGAAAGWWWLRSPGGNQGRAAYVDSDGSFTGRSVNDYFTVVRPAIWVDPDIVPSDSSVDSIASQVQSDDAIKYRAICVGENYSSAFTKITQSTGELNGAVPDAERLSVLLSTVGQYEVRFLTDATKSVIKNTIAVHFQGTTENDVSVFFFSGHGDTDGSPQTFDGSTFITFTLNGSSYYDSITIQELMGWLNDIKGVKVIILDSCFSGSFIDNNPYLDDRTVVMTACRNNQTAGEGAVEGDPTGIFSFFIREGIDGMEADENTDSCISAGELSRYVDQAMSGRYTQQCQFFNCSDDIIIIAKPVPKVFR